MSVQSMKEFRRNLATRPGLSTLNRELKKLGFEEFVVRENNRKFYFSGGNTATWAVREVEVNSIFDLTLDQWVAELRLMKARYES